MAFRQSRVVVVGLPSPPSRSCSGHRRNIKEKFKMREWWSFKKCFVNVVERKVFFLSRECFLSFCSWYLQWTTLISHHHNMLNILLNFVRTTGWHVLTHRVACQASGLGGSDWCWLAGCVLYPNSLFFGAPMGWPFLPSLHKINYTK